MGSGKTSVGAELARRLGCEFIDLDRRVEAHFGKTVARIFAEDGEAAFRLAERAALEPLLTSATPERVIALGGGAFVQPEIAERLAAAGDLIILLDAPAEVLQQRKQELPPHETARQRDAYLALVRSLSNGRLVDASDRRENVAKATAQIVLRHLSARAAGLLRQR